MGGISKHSRISGLLIISSSVSDGSMIMNGE